MTSCKDTNVTCEYTTYYYEQHAANVPSGEGGTIQLHLSLHTCTWIISCTCYMYIASNKKIAGGAHTRASSRTNKGNPIRKPGHSRQTRHHTHALARRIGSNPYCMTSSLDHRGKPTTAALDILPVPAFAN